MIVHWNRGKVKHIAVLITFSLSRPNCHRLQNKNDIEMLGTITNDHLQFNVYTIHQQHPMQT